jgi:hypothetical protein
MCDILFAKVVKARDNYRCVRCGRGDPLDCAHNIRRWYLRTRWELDNAWALCRPCHRLVDHDAAAKAELIAQTIGEERNEELVALSRPTSGPLPDRPQIRAVLRQMLRDFQVA